MSLKQIIAAAKNKKKSSAKTFKDGKKIFDIQIKYDVTYEKYIVETILAETEEEALIQARRQFHSKEEKFLIKRGTVLTDTKPRLQITSIPTIKIKKTLNLTPTQKLILRKLLAGYKLYPWDINSYLLDKVTPSFKSYNDENICYMSSLKSLLTKNLIIPLSQLDVSNEEIDIQIALGTLQRDKPVYVLNAPQIVQYGLVLTPYVEE